MRAFLRVEPTGTIASFEQVGIPMATELVGGIVFYPPQKTQTCKPFKHASGGSSPTGRAAAYLYRASTRVYAVPPLGLEPRTQGF